MAVFDAQVPTCLGSYGWSKIDFRNFFQKHTPRPEITQKVEKLGQKNPRSHFEGFLADFQILPLFQGRTFRDQNRDFARSISRAQMHLFN